MCYHARMACVHSLLMQLKLGVKSEMQESAAMYLILHARPKNQIPDTEGEGYGSKESVSIILGFPSTATLSCSSPHHLAQGTVTLANCK